MASQAVKNAITEAASQYSKPEGKVFQYGTAGVCAFPLRISRYCVDHANFIIVHAVPHESVSRGSFFAP